LIFFLVWDKRINMGVSQRPLWSC